MGERDKPHSYRMAPGAIPRPGRVPEQRFLSPRNLSLMAAARQTFSWKMIHSFRVLASGAINRPKYDGQRRPWAPHHVPGQPEGGRATTWCGWLVALLLLPFGLRVHVGKIGGWIFVSSNSQNISCVTFLKPKTAKNTQLALWHLVNRLVQ